MTPLKPLSTAAQAVLLASAAVRCSQEWGNVNDPPCHPEDPKWKGCRMCIDGPASAAVLRALVESHGTLTRGGAVILNGDDVLAIATELELPHA